MKRYDDHSRAEALLPQITYVEKPHYLSSMEKYEGYKSYAVMLGDRLLGTVDNVRESNHRKAGRLIVRTTYSKKWGYRPADISIRPAIGLYYSSRKRATLELLADLSRHNKLGKV